MHTLVANKTMVKNESLRGKRGCDSRTGQLQPIKTDLKDIERRNTCGVELSRKRKDEPKTRGYKTHRNRTQCMEASMHCNDTEPHFIILSGKYWSRYISANCGVHTRGDNTYIHHQGKTLADEGERTCHDDSQEDPNDVTATNGTTSHQRASCMQAVMSFEALKAANKTIAKPYPNAKASTENMKR